MTLQTLDVVGTSSLRGMLCGYVCLCYSCVACAPITLQFGGAAFANMPSLPTNNIHVNIGEPPAHNPTREFHIHDQQLTRKAGITFDIL